MNLNNKNNKNQYISLFTYLILSFILLSISLTRIFDPVYLLTANISGNLSSKFYSNVIDFKQYTYYFTNSSKIIEENNNLKDDSSKIADLESQIANLKSENNILKNQLGVKDKINSKIILSSIIYRSDFLDYINIDKGYNDGVEKGNNIIYENNLIGNVIEVYPNSSRVQLISNIQSHIPVSLVNSDNTYTNGTLVGSAINGLEIEDILPTDKVEDNSLVITSDLDQMYKKGLVVGKVTKIDNISSKSERLVFVTSLIDLNLIKNVFIISNN